MDARFVAAIEGCSCWAGWAGLSQVAAAVGQRGQQGVSGAALTLMRWKQRATLPARVFRPRPRGVTALLETDAAVEGKKKRRRGSACPAAQLLTGGPAKDCRPAGMAAGTGPG
jgi:hypothetical protein